MLRIANGPAMVMPVTVVIVVPIPLVIPLAGGLDYTGGGESDHGEYEAAAHKAPRGRHPWISHVVPFFLVRWR
jgi:hypothetical protein